MEDKETEDNLSDSYEMSYMYTCFSLCASLLTPYNSDSLPKLNDNYVGTMVRHFHMYFSVALTITNRKFREEGVKRINIIS